jgi:hypothetical protein
VDFALGAWVMEESKRRGPHLFQAVLSHSCKAYSEVGRGGEGKGRSRDLKARKGHRESRDPVVSDGGVRRRPDPERLK